MSKCKVEVITNNGTTEYVLSGSIDETLIIHFDLFTETQDVVMLHLDGVIAINSTGIREWINLMGRLKSAKIRLSKCPKVIVDQINMVKGFLPTNASVDSFYVPYFSEQSSSEKKILFERNRQFTDKEVSFENSIIDEDGASFEIDIIPDKYFKFIRN